VYCGNRREASNRNDASKISDLVTTASAAMPTTAMMPAIAVMPGTPEAALEFCGDSKKKSPYKPYPNPLILSKS
jgi:hypothetical protein